MATIAKHFYQNQPASTLEQLARHVSVPPEAMTIVLGEIESAGFLKRTGDEPPTYLPARALETIAIKELLEDIRAAGESKTFSEKRLNGDPDIDDLLRRIDGAVGDALEGYTLRDLAVKSPADSSPAKGTSDRKVIRAS
jgi:membrane protein